MERTKNANNASSENNFFHVCGKCKLGCCRNAKPPITGKRRRIVENYFLAQGLRIENPFDKAAYAFPRETGGGFCVFFDEEAGKCLVHSVKPETCVAGPVTFDINLRTGKIEWFLKYGSICPLAGVLYEDGEALEKHLSSAKKTLQKLVQELDAEALCAILKIEEPETFKIGEDSLSSEVLEKITENKE